MAIREYRPTSAGRRAGSVQVTRAELAPSSAVEDSLVVRLRKTGGRNHQGKITSRHRGGGSRRLYRKIDFKRSASATLTVQSVQYDPNRNARILLCVADTGAKTYVLAPDGIGVGAKITNAVAKADPVVGATMRLSEMPLGIRVHNIEMYPDGGGKLCRSAGSSATLNARDAGWAQITLPSGEVRRVSAECFATIGVVGNAEHQNVSIGKAGRNRWKGIRPYVRGVAMNPIAHPMGGGEGRTSGGRHPCSPTGKLAKGGRTRRRKNPTSQAIVKRRVSRRNGQLKT